MIYRHPVTELIRRRFSCRTFAPEPIEIEDRRTLEAAAAGMRSGPLGSPLRFRLVAESDEDQAALKELGTYGFIRGAAGFLIGAAPRSQTSLEDCGYRLEELVLLGTDLELGSCWLGGTFTRSGFARKIGLAPDEELPAAVALGRIADPERAKRGVIRRAAGSDTRLPWGMLFFQDSFSVPLPREAAGPYAEALETVRLAPSASNKQPWRILRTDGGWHFYLRRTRGYHKGFLQKALGVADLQRIDIGIAMCHFELAAREAGLHGEWTDREPAVETENSQTEYRITWSD
ncbi:MAG: hypothetical protein JW929_03915 [Anaerolineales bacterium]|nr:hypothetical protein [Anaerolineales bacterium]